MRAGRHDVPRTAIVLVSGVLGVSALAGGFGLITGYLPTPGAVNARLPFASPVVGGVALLAFVAAPMASVAILAAHHHPRARGAAALGGLLLIGWIAVEVAIIRAYSPLQVVCGAAGCALVALGRRPRHAAWVRSGSPDHRRAPRG